MAWAGCEAGVAFEDVDMASFCDGRNTKKLMGTGYAFETRRLHFTAAGWQ